MDWKTLLAYITGSVDQELLLRNEYLVTENRILRNQITGRIRLNDGERKALAVDKNFSATRQGWSKGIGGGDTFMKLCASSSGCETRPAKGEPARVGSKPCDGLGKKAGEA